MEVLGAVSSSIAVLQALAAGKYVVNLIREVPDIQSDFDNLMKELGLIRSMTKAVSGIPSTPLEQELIRSAADDLNEILGELDTLLRSCACETDQQDKKVLKTRKRKWLLEGSSIKKLQQRMANAKNTLHFALTSSRTSNDAQFQAEMRQMFMSFCRMHMESRAVIEDPQTQEVIANQASNELQNDTVAATSVMTIPNEGDSISLASQLIRVKSRTFVKQASYASSCQCRCHFSESIYQASGWMQSLLGSWLVRCNSLPRKECSDPRCRCTSSTVLKMEYQVPTWLLSRAFRFSASYCSLTGLNFSIRPVKLLDVTSTLWECQEGSIEVIRESVINNHVYPNDSDVTGEGLMQYALSRQLYPAVEVLLDLWKNMLPEIGLPRGIIYVAGDLLQSVELNDHETYLVEKALSFVKDQPEGTRTKIHRALCRSTGLHEALLEQPWAIDTIDNAGLAPLHLAVQNNQLEEVGILIAAGANVDQLTYNGRTALLLAVDRQNIEMVKLFLKAKCSVNIADRDMRTALHYASIKNTPGLVGLLLAAGASTTHCDRLNHTALHKVAMYSRASLENMKTIIEMLIMAGADLEAREFQGGTPMLQALFYDNTTAVRALVETGCSVLASDHESLNLLHFASRHVCLELLEYLCGLCLNGINPYQQDSWGDTPWDELIRVINCDEESLGDARRPSPAEQEAYMRLYQGIRDQNLQHDIDSLERALSALREQDAATARKHLAPLIKKEKDWQRDNLVSWYRAVDKRIQHLEWDLGVEDVEGYITDLIEELDTPVWKLPSEYGCLWDNTDEDLVNEE